jgi:hypothetical protein
VKQYTRLVVDFFERKRNIKRERDEKVIISSIKYNPEIQSTPLR